MTQELKMCQNCKQEFKIEQEDFEFYEKMQVPSPTFCPQCRLQRRLAWRNERMLYARNCSATGDRIVSFYSGDTPFPVYKREYWYSDKWDATQHGRGYDFSKNFFSQYIELMRVTPRIQLWTVNAVNSDYSNYIVDSKECYLCYSALGGNESCLYSSYLTNSSYCMDCYLIKKCELCYQCVNCETCYNLKFAAGSVNCRDSWFLIDCNNCTNCFGCVGLKDKQYYFFNEPTSKEEYAKKLEELNPSSRENHPDYVYKLRSMTLKFPKRFMYGRKNENVSGDYVNNSKNVHNSYFVTDTEDSKNLYFCLSARACYDVTVSPLSNEFLYECHAIPKSNYFLRFCELCSNGCRYLEYCSNCDSCSYCFGCIGLRGKEYCILNKQYSKEEYETLRAQIISHSKTMPYVDSGGCTYTYGEFFPLEISPFAYNESVAYEYFPLKKEEVLRRGYVWKELASKNYQATKPSYKIPDVAKTISEETISQDIFGCMHEGNCTDNCTIGFRITNAELQLYKQLEVPLPKLCPNCRYRERLMYRNPLKLYDRTCQCAGAQSESDIYSNVTEHVHGRVKNCDNVFKTTYAPSEPEIVYCEACYQSEII